MPPVFTVRITKRKGVFLVQIVDATGAVRFTRRFHTRVQVLRQDLNGDGLAEIILQFRQGRKLRRLVFSGATCCRTTSWPSGSSTCCALFGGRPRSATPSPSPAVRRVLQPAPCCAS